MSCSTILLKVGLVNFIFFQLCNEGVHNIVTVPLVVESVCKKMCLTMRLRDIPTQTPVFSSCWATRGTHGIVCTPDMWVLTVDVFWQMEVLPRLWRMWCPKCHLRGQESLKFTCRTLPT
jgi:hypothetical protein